MASEFKWSNGEAVGKADPGVALPESSAIHDVPVAAQTGEGARGFLDSIFEWLGDLFASLFGGGPDDDDGVEVADTPLAYEPPHMEDDVILNGILPPVAFEEDFGLDDIGDEGFEELGLLV